MSRSRLARPPQNPIAGTREEEEQSESLEGCNAPCTQPRTPKQGGGSYKNASDPEGAERQTEVPTGDNRRSCSPAGTEQAGGGYWLSKEMGLGFCLEIYIQDLSSPVVTKTNKKPTKLVTRRLLLVLALQSPAVTIDKCHCCSGPVLPPIQSRGLGLRPTKAL